MTNRFLLTIILAACAATSGHAATLLNGGFEDPALAVDTSQEFGLGETLPGWSIAITPVDLVNSTFAADEGLQSVELNRTQTSTLSQVIADFVIGQEYILSFAIGMNPFAAVSLGSVSVSVFDVSEGFVVNRIPTVDAPPDAGWRTEEIQFTATDTEGTLSFLAGRTSSTRAVVLDDVRLEAVGPPVGVIPLPAGGWLLVMAIGALAASRRVLRA